MPGIITGKDQSPVTGVFSEFSEPRFAKVPLVAKNFVGGVAKQVFSAKEILETADGTEYSSISVPRDVVSIPGDAAQGNSAKTTFRLGDDFFGGPDVSRHHMLWICGMWDLYKQLAFKYSALHKTMPTFGKFRITINGTVAFDDYVFFWNYRRWKFWPCVTIDVPENLFKPGMNTLVFENRTRPFLEDVPEYYKPYSNQPGGIAADDIPAQIKNNTLFHLSSIHVVTRTFNDLEVMNSPSVVNVANRFAVELFATRKHDMELRLSDGIKALKVPSVRQGRNIFFFRADESGSDLSIAFHSRTTGRHSSVIIKWATSAPAGAFLLGHILGGHLSALPINHDYRHLVELFRDTRQGNLLVWLAAPQKAGDNITAQMLPIKDIKNSGMKVALRYYGASRASFPTERPYHEEVRTIVSDLGSAFVGLATHEFGGHARKALDESHRREVAIKKFACEAARVIDELKTLAPRSKVWITDPSLYSDLYCQVGADLPGLELFPLHCTLNIAACRGAAKAFRKSGWAAINSFECQAYGGLTMCEPMAYLDPRHSEKRLNLWRLSQFYLYLAGCRTIYSESGAFEQVVGRQLTLDHPDMVQFRDVQRNLFDFSKIHPLTTQPVADFAFIKSQNDLFGGIYVPSSRQKLAPSDSSWEKLRSAIPQLQWRDDRAESLNGEQCRPDFSDTPFGEVDVVPANKAPIVLGKYRAAVLVGQHEISALDAKHYKKYARNGGQLIITLADFVNADGKIHQPRIVRQLCGVTPVDESQESYLWEINVCDSTFRRDIGDVHVPCVLGRGAYDGLMIGGLDVSDKAETMICDGFTCKPFLIRRRFGRGAVWLINALNHHANPNYLRLVNRIIQAIFGSARGPLQLINSQNINYFVYEHDLAEQSFQQVLVLNNDWWSTSESHRAQFDYKGTKFDLFVNRAQPGQFFICHDVIIVPESVEFRINSALSRDDGSIEIECEGLGEVLLRFYSAGRIKSVHISAGNGKYKSERVSQKEPALVVAARLGEPCRISIEMCSSKHARHVGCTGTSSV